MRKLSGLRSSDILKFYEVQRNVEVTPIISLTKKMTLSTPEKNSNTLEYHIDPRNRSI